MKLLIIDNYDSFTFNLVQLVEQCGNTDFEIVKNDKLFDLNVDGFDKVLISPGPGIAEEAGDLMEFLRKNYRQKSILGICLGYEALGEMLGACLTKLPQPMHGIQNKGRVLVNNKIFKGLPSVFKIGHYHSWIIEEASIPPALEVILKDENVKAILLNIFGGIVRCDRVAQGVVDAYEKIGDIKIPVIVRLQGTNATEGKELIDNSGLKVHSAITLQEAADLVKELV